MKKTAAAIAVASLIGASALLAQAETAGDSDGKYNANTGTEMRKGGSAGADAQMRQGADAQMRDRVGVDTADDDADERPENYPADNSGRNQRDADGKMPTADDQSNNKQDLEITQSIRRAVTDDDSLSMNAKNVKIITNGGVVTLRGPVKDEAEKAKIANAAKGVNGVTRVDNQLEVAR